MKLLKGPAQTKKNIKTVKIIFELIKKKLDKL